MTVELLKEFIPMCCFIFLVGMGVGSLYAKKMFLWELKYKSKTGIRLSLVGYFFQVKNLGRIKEGK